MTEPTVPEAPPQAAPGRAEPGTTREELRHHLVRNAVCALESRSRRSLTTLIGGATPRLVRYRGPVRNTATQH